MVLERRRIGKTELTVCRMGLAGGYGLPALDVRWAIETGIDYLWWQPEWTGMTAALKELLPGQRSRLVIATGTYHRDGPGALADLDKALRTLGVEFVDVFMFRYIDSKAQWGELKAGGLEAVARARAQGKTRYVGFSAHHRPLAGQMVASGAFDIATLRYNCAHVGAEAEVFPTTLTQSCGVVVFTALRWGELLSSPSGWKGPVPRPWEFYRFVLEHPAVDVVMTAPRTREQLAENIKAVEADICLSPQRLEEIRAYGRYFREQMG